LTANGIQVTYFPHARPAAMLSFAVRNLEASAGVMISAAHDLSADDRLVCYDARGRRLVGPEVAALLERIEAARNVRQEPFLDAFRNGRISMETEPVEEAYLAAVRAEGFGEFHEMSVLFTPMYGAGEYSIEPVLRRAGLKRLHLLTAERMIQRGIPTPPARFPDVADPRAYEPAIQAAESLSCDLILASDLDGGRLGAAVRSRQGNYVVLTSGQIAALVCDYVMLQLTRLKQRGTRDFLVNSPIGTDFLRRLAGHYGVHLRHDLPVGFGYIAREIDADLAERFIFAADEDHGYLKGVYCREKDAAVAALLLAEHSAGLKLVGKTLLEELDALYVGHGVHAETTVTWDCRDFREQEQLFGDLGVVPPEEIGGMPLFQMFDYDRQQTRSIPNDQPIEAEPAFQDRLLLFRFEKKEDGFGIRPLSDMPAMKANLFTFGECGSFDCLPEVRQETQARLATMRDGLVHYLALAAERVSATR
jgi:phosphoglucomutase/phosphomannomutase